MNNSLFDDRMMSFDMDDCDYDDGDPELPDAPYSADAPYASGAAATYEQEAAPHPSASQTVPSEGIYVPDFNNIESSDSPQVSSKAQPPQQAAPNRLGPNTAQVSENGTAPSGGWSPDARSVMVGVLIGVAGSLAYWWFFGKE